MYSSILLHAIQSIYTPFSFFRQIFPSAKFQVIYTHKVSKMNKIESPRLKLQIIIISVNSHSRGLDILMQAHDQVFHWQTILL